MSTIKIKLKNEFLRENYGNGVGVGRGSGDKSGEKGDLAWGGDHMVTIRIG